MLYTNGDRFAGHFHKNLAHGSGAYFWSETGSVYCGEWSAGERRGRGSFLFGPRRRHDDKLGGAVVSGRWLGDKLVSPGEAAYVDEEGVVHSEKLDSEEQQHQRSEVAAGGGRKKGSIRRLMKTLSLK